MTDRRTEKRIIVFVAVFYVIVSLFAVCVLNLSGSVFAKRGEADILKYLRGRGTEDDGTYDTGNAGDKLEGLEALDSDDGEDEAVISEDETTYEDEPYEDESYEEAPATDEPADDEYVEEDTQEHFYSFKSNNTEGRLRMREEPGESGRIVYELKPGSEGYIIELGDDWSKVSAYGHEGYCANEYLTMTEITEDEYDSLVSASHDIQETDP